MIRLGTSLQCSQILLPFSAYAWCSPVLTLIHSPIAPFLEGQQPGCIRLPAVFADPHGVRFFYRRENRETVTIFTGLCLFLAGLK